MSSEALIFDSHAHYDDRAFDGDRYELLDSFNSKGICAVINAGCDIKSSKESISLSEKYGFIYAAVGVHPQSVENETDFINKLKDLIKSPKVVAVGEIGLDYHYGSKTKDLQIKVFEEQMKLAVKNDMPIVVHDREAHGDTMAILKRYNPKGVVHCFSGSVEMANEIIKLGMYIGIGGAVTFKNAKTVVNVVHDIPQEYILLETDAPYMTPVPFRGKRCDSSHIQLSAKRIAEIRGCSLEDVLNFSKDNAIRLFKLEGKI